MTLNTYTVAVRVTFSVALLAFLPFLAKAQVSILATDHVVQPEETFTVDIKGIGFTDILACQFSITWDSTAIQFQGTENLNTAFEDYPLEHFGSPANGTIGFTWFDFTIQGVNLPDTAVLFSFRFKVIQEESGEYKVGFGGMPTAIEVADTGENILDVEFHEGTINIDGVSDVLAPGASDYVQVRSAPNPFRQQTQVQLDFLQPADTQISVYAPDGRLLLEEKRFFSTGRSSIDLNEDIFSRPGVYLLKIQSQGFMVQQKLIAL